MRYLSFQVEISSYISHTKTVIKKIEIFCTIKLFLEKKKIWLYFEK